MVERTPEQRQNEEINSIRDRITKTIESTLGVVAVSPQVSSFSVPNIFCSFGKLYNEQEDIVGLFFQSQEHKAKVNDSLSLASIETFVLSMDKKDMYVKSDLPKDVTSDAPESEELFILYHMARVRKKEGTSLTLGDYRRFERGVKFFSPDIKSKILQSRKKQ